MGAKDSCLTPFTSIYDITELDIDGVPRSLSLYASKILLIVNVASK
jgi:glutathione peroxidase-family protein